MTHDVLGAIVAMAAVTYALRAVPLLGLANHLPRPVTEYLRLVAPAILAALATVSVAVVVTVGGHGERIPTPHLGLEAIGVLACVVVVRMGRSLLLGLVAAVAVVATATALGIG